VGDSGFEPLTSSASKKYDTLLEISAACKMPANCRICPSARFSRFQEIYSGCCTVAAQTLPLLPPYKVREDRYSPSRLEPPYASFVLGVFPKVSGRCRRPQRAERMRARIAYPPARNA
jgi:hypothetical protein